MEKTISTAQFYHALGNLGESGTDAPRVQPESGCSETITALLHTMKGYAFGVTQERMQDKGRVYLGDLDVYGQELTTLVEQRLGMAQYSEEFAGDLRQVAEEHVASLRKLFEETEVPQAA
ncbi:hypothetical protein COU80_00710 [Candidatus Peregrinibacteria bacterium CG10_big_fil_rev_8_21_14_0_10_55_24]|nr:MAG: hypothetical protein COU80_00710 [Candidatus Peregrinibacteria bacterium CG10_big_fil_rev_8_21_14_0_10_55_24]